MLYHIILSTKVPTYSSPNSTSEANDTTTIAHHFVPVSLVIIICMEFHLMVRFQLIFVANKVETGQVGKVLNEQVTKRSRHAVAIDLSMTFYLFRKVHQS